MNNRKATKRALLTSVMALVMCVVMLLGTTFAWFTDTARTNVNTIKSGNLDVVLQVKDNNGDWITSNRALTWVKSTAGSGQELLWEPGASYNLEEFRILNNGNLNLKYKVIISGATGDTMLLDVIDFSGKITDENNAVTDLPSVSMNSATPVILDRALAAGKADTITLNGTMQTSANNTYMSKKVNNITIDVYATQATGEYDSTRNDYDENATYPDVAFVTVAAPTAEETAAGVNPLAKALTAASAETNADGSVKKKITADLGAGTFTLTDKEGESKAATAGKEITLAGAGKENTTFTAEKTDDTHGEANGTYCFDGAKSVVLKDMTVKFDNNKDYQGFVRAGVIRFENCTIIGKQVLNANEAEFINCVFENSNDYCVWTYGSPNVTFTNCEFKTGGKAILIYNEYTDKNFLATVKVKQCSFNDDGTLTEKDGSNLLKAAIETGTNGGNTATSNRYIIEVEGTTVTGFAMNNTGIPSNSTLWANKSGMDKDHLSVTVNGTKEY